MCLESGKPRSEAKGELNYARSFIDMYAGMGSNGLVLPAQNDKHMLLATKEVRAHEPAKKEDSLSYFCSVR